MLQKTLPVWKASEYHYYLGSCLWYARARVAAPGSLDEALSRFDEAKANFLHVGAEHECRPSTRGSPSAIVRKGEPDAALELARRACSAAPAIRTAWRGWCRCSIACRRTRC